MLGYTIACNNVVFRAATIPSALVSDGVKVLCTFPRQPGRIRSYIGCLIDEACRRSNYGSTGRRRAYAVVLLTIGTNRFELASYYFSWCESTFHKICLEQRTF